MAYVRVLRAWRGLHCGIYADVKGTHLREGLEEGALDDKADVPDGHEVKHSLGEDDKAKKK